MEYGPSFGRQPDRRERVHERRAQSQKNDSQSNWGRKNLNLYICSGSVLILVFFLFNHFPTYTSSPTVPPSHGLFVLHHPIFLGSFYQFPHLLLDDLQPNDCSDLREHELPDLQTRARAALVNPLLQDLTTAIFNTLESLIQNYTQPELEDARSAGNFQREVSLMDERFEGVRSTVLDISNSNQRCEQYHANRIEEARLEYENLDWTWMDNWILSRIFNSKFSKAQKRISQTIRRERIILNRLSSNTDTISKFLRTMQDFHAEWVGILQVLQSCTKARKERCYLNVAALKVWIIEHLIVQFDFTSRDMTRNYFESAWKLTGEHSIPCQLSALFENQPYTTHPVAFGLATAPPQFGNTMLVGPRTTYDLPHTVDYTLLHSTLATHISRARLRLPQATPVISYISCPPTWPSSVLLPHYPVNLIDSHPSNHHTLNITPHTGGSALSYEDHAAVHKESDIYSRYILWCWWTRHSANLAPLRSLLPNSSWSPSQATGHTG
ncbi:hypothetical protein BDR22DRAFT_821413 [Usnea florida]